MDGHSSSKNQSNAIKRADMPSQWQEAISKAKVNLFTTMKINLTWFINLNVKGEAMKTLDENRKVSI